MALFNYFDENKLSCSKTKLELQLLLLQRKINSTDLSHYYNISFEYVKKERINTNKTYTLKLFSSGSSKADRSMPHHIGMLVNSGKMGFYLAAFYLRNLSAAPIWQNPPW